VELVTLPGMLQTNWNTTADGWNERTANIRHDYALDESGSNAPKLAAANTSNGWSLWAKGYYAQDSRDRSIAISALGTSFAYDTSYTQNMAGFQIGGDLMIRDDANGAWVIGVLGGYNSGDEKFHVNADKSDTTIYNAGIYGSYLDGPFFADLLIKDDIASFKLNLPSVSSGATVKGTDYGGEINVGAHLDGGPDIGGIFFEPTGTLSYVRSNVDNLNMPGTRFQWDNATSFRGRLGLRAGANLVVDQTTIQPFLYAGIGEEFEGDNHMTLSGGGESVTLTDKPVRTFGQGSLGVNIFGNNGWSGFLRLDGFEANHAEGYAARIGIKYTFGEP